MTAMLDIGEHCFQCNKRDFLPFTCPKCQKVLCGDHWDHHECDPTPAQTLLAKPSKRQPTAKDKPASKSMSSKQETRAPPASRALAGSRAQMASPVVSAGQAALNRLKGLLKSQISPSATQKPPLLRTLKKSAISADMIREAKGDLSVARDRRVYVTIERLSRPYVDAITGKEQLRPAKTVPLFFDEDTLLGVVFDKASNAVGVRVKSLTLNGALLDARQPIKIVAQGSKLVAVEA